MLLNVIINEYDHKAQTEMDRCTHTRGTRRRTPVDSWHM